MPVCFRHALLVNKATSAIGNGRVMVGDVNGSAIAPLTQPFVPTLVKSVEDVDSCDAVALTGAEYKSMLLALSAPVEGAADVNVTADIFVGCLLVLCFIGGWISGAQR